MAEAHSSDILIIGSGAAGLTAALNLADRFKVTVLAKGALNEGSTAWAQGGIAAVLEPGDTFESHIEDTMIAGAGLNDRRIVHVNDATGWAVQEALQRAAEAHPNITLVPDMVAIDLATSRHEMR